MLKEFINKRKDEFKVLYKILLTGILGFLAINLPLNLIRDLSISLSNGSFLFNNIFLPRSGFMKFVSYTYLTWHTFKFLLGLVMVLFRTSLDVIFILYYKINI